MKYAAIILSGAPDEPLDALDGKTPLESASLPNLARLAATGRVGSALTIPEDLAPSPEVGVTSILGFDPLEVSVGRAPLEAAALGVQLGPRDWVLRVSLVTVGEVEEEAGVLVDAAPDALTEREARVLLTDLLSHWRAIHPDLSKGLTLATGTGKRLMLIDASGVSYRKVDTTPPTMAWQEPLRDHLPSGGGEAARLRKLIESSQVFLSRHEVNLARAEQGLRPANLAWIWGQGAPVQLSSFEDRFGIRGTMFANDDAIGGLAVAAGMDRLPAFCGHPDDLLGLDALRQAASDALRRCDLVCCHIEDPGLASFHGDARRKVEVLEEIDAQLVGPLVRDLDDAYSDPSLNPASEGWRLLVISDCVSATESRRFGHGPVPFLMVGAWVRSVMQRPFTEAAAAESDLYIAPAHDLMEYFLRGGLASVKARTR